MKILVSVTGVVDYNLKVRVKCEVMGVDNVKVKRSINPFVEIAIEDAVRLKEKGVASEVIAFLCGVAQCQERAQRLAGCPDRQDRRAAVRRYPHFRRHPAPCRHEGLQGHCGDRQGCRGTVFSVADCGLDAAVFAATPEFTQALD